MKRDGHSAKRKILPLFLCLLLSLTMVPTVALAEGRTGAATFRPATCRLRAMVRRAVLLPGRTRKGVLPMAPKARTLGVPEIPTRKVPEIPRANRARIRTARARRICRPTRKTKAIPFRATVLHLDRILCSCAGRQGLARCGRSFRFAERGGTPSSAEQRRGIPSGCIVACSQRFPRHSILHGHHRAANESLYRAVGGGRSG